MKNRRFTMTVLLCILSLLFCALLSVAYGSKAVSFQTVFRSLFHFASDSFDASVVQARIPRTVFGILAGAALAVSGSVMQAVTRNPIADPSILGVNTGASLFVVCGIAFFHISSGNQYIWLAFAGASITAVLVYGLASAGHEGGYSGKAGSGRRCCQHCSSVSGKYCHASQHTGYESVSFLADRKHQRRCME